MTYESPRTCLNCNQTSWENPIPVVVAKVIIGGGILLIRRARDPGLGKLAFPGGYLEIGETWQEGMSRELREETSLDIAPSLFRLDGIESSTDKERIIIFGRTPYLPSNIISEFTPNSEVSELVITNQDTELAFPTHTKALSQYLVERNG